MKDVERTGSRRFMLSRAAVVAAHKRLPSGLTLKPSYKWVQVPPGDSLPPEAIGAVMEVTKWLKPSISGSRIGDRASVQAATRVNAEQASKRTMCRPTRRPLPGKADTAG